MEEGFPIPLHTGGSSVVDTKDELDFNELIIPWETDDDLDEEPETQEDENLFQMRDEQLKDKAYQNQPVQLEEATVDKIKVHCLNCDTTLDVAHVHSKSIVCGGCKSSTWLSYRCAICRNTYANSTTAYTNVRYECNKLPQFQCTYCNYRAKRKDHLWRHIQLKHTVKNYASYRNRFSNKPKSNAHTMSTCARQFQCEHCAYRAKRKDHIAKHIRCMHSAKKCPGCGTEFSNKAELKLHLSIHKQCKPRAMPYERKFQCDQCAYRATWKANLVRHIQLVHGIERSAAKQSLFGCPHCDYRAKQKGNLLRHIRRKHAA